MPTTKQKYILGQRHQLIDLNKTFKNFKLQFQVVATEPNMDFHAIVLNQEQLDGTTDLQQVEMKLAKGRIGGTIVADNDKYQNYFLVLKSSPAKDNTEVEVTTTLEEVEPQPTPSTPVEKEETNENYTETEAPNTTQKTMWYQQPWFWILVLALVVGGAYYYYFYMYKKDTIPCVEDMMVEIPPVAAPVSVPEPVLVPVETTVPVPEIPVRSTKKTTSKQTLYDKLAEIA